MRLIDIYFNDMLEPGEAEVILFTLLSERKPEQSISHKKMPTFEEHKKFVQSRPYKNWYLIWGDNMDGDAMGSIYITQNNEIGISIFEDSQHKGYGKKAIHLLMVLHRYTECFYANVAPLNVYSNEFFIHLGFNYDHEVLDKDKVVIQYTYRIVNPYYVK